MQPSSVNQEIITQGIKYTGSKLKLIPYILDIIDELNVKKILDGFSGTTRVSQALAKKGYDVVSNDISAWSEVFGKCFLLFDKSVSYYQSLIDELNSLPGTMGWFSKHYGGVDLATRKHPFQLKNMMKLDSIRERIDQMRISDVDRSVLLTSLILALDKVDSTIGHFVSYLSEWSERSYNDLHLEVPLLCTANGEHQVFRSDIFDLIQTDTYDLAYFDPPYGSNNEKMPPSRVRYSSYYHFYTTVVLNDKPKLFGKANRREDSRDLVNPSVFEEYKKNENGKFIATEAIKNLIDKTNAKYILFSYSNGGRATEEELHEIFTTHGKLIKVVEIDYKKNIMSTMKWTNEWLGSDKKNTEFLFLIQKN